MPFSNANLAAPCRAPKSAARYLGLPPSKEIESCRQAGAGMSTGLHYRSAVFLLPFGHRVPMFRQAQVRPRTLNALLCYAVAMPAGSAARFRSESGVFFHLSLETGCLEPIISRSSFVLLRRPGGVEYSFEVFAAPFDPGFRSAPLRKWAQRKNALATVGARMPLWPITDAGLLPRYPHGAFRRAVSNGLLPALFDSLPMERPHSPWFTRNVPRIW